MNVARERRAFPALRGRPGHPPPIYLDSACMSLVPQPVLDAMHEYYTEFPGCAGRSLHRFAEEVTSRYAAAREGFSRFLNAGAAENVVFVRNATEAINLVGQGLPWKRGDRVVVSDQEHSSNLVLWQRLARERGIRMEILRLSDDGSFDLGQLDAALRPGTRLVSLFHVSNLDGRALPARAIVEHAHDRGAKVMFDGCQAAPHEPVDFGAIGADFYAFSAHKMMGPTGTGVLLGRPEALAELRPLLLGGETVEWTTLADHALRPPPYRFEAGLQNYAGVLGAHAGIRFLERIGVEEVRSRLTSINEEVTRALADEPRLRVLGPTAARDRPSIYAFCIEGVDPHDAALFLDAGYRVMVRSGRHCVHSWYDRHGLSGNVRASFYLYTSDSDARTFVRGVRELLERVPAQRVAASSAVHRRGRRSR